MNSYRRKAAQRIAAASMILAITGSPLAWLISRENAEESIVAFAMEESRRLLPLSNVSGSATVLSRQQAQAGADALAGGIFDIAEIYDRHGNKIAEQLSPFGHRIEGMLPHHSRPSYTQPGYENLPVQTGTEKQTAIRVMLPLFNQEQQVYAYFEGVRVLPAWQVAQISTDAAIVALMVAIASLLTGLAIYPVVTYLSKENAQKTKELFESHISMMEALGRAIAKRDSDTGSHNYRVAWLSAKLAEILGFRGARMQGLMIGSFLHDVGKIGIPDAILLKPGKHTTEETTIMRMHVTHGKEIVHGAGWLPSVAAVVEAHHEKWNGDGYPEGLHGEQIPLEARIFAIMDVFDALCSRRPYKEAFSFEQAMSILEDGRGTHFDPDLLDHFLQIARQLHQELSSKTEDQIRDNFIELMQLHFVRD
ncbi:HD-GYP domain-containing protein [Undibacterium sp. SXout7W]|uniref:HD-GYP domain-containing protein n=1 Tax=Undibacterium sp. SXout7W TaxID=3413049 RepID=UPI003BF0B708